MKKHDRSSLSGLVIDCHSHAGVSINTYARMEYPYAATIEGLYYRQKACGVDVNIVFPYTADLFFDIGGFIDMRMQPADNPISPVPYGIENELLLREVYDYCPELSKRFLPFVSVDPARHVEEQIKGLEALSGKYPIYGVKVSGVLCHSPVTAFLQEGLPLMRFIAAKNWPVLLHASYTKTDAFSNHDLIFQVVEAFPEVRFCLAHSLAFVKSSLDRAAALPNAWVDTSALAIHAQSFLKRRASEVNTPVGERPERIDTDYENTGRILKSLAQAYPGKIIWGTDTPAYSYICRRRQSADCVVEFKLKATYEDEVEALRYLPVSVQMELANHNTLDFLFEPQSSMSV